jgi:hypothetical protein
LPSATPDSTLVLSALEANLLAGDISKQTHDSITAQIDSGAVTAAQAKPQNGAVARKPGNQPRSSEVNTIAGLLLGSPEFQKR